MKVSASRGKNRLNFKGCFQYSTEENGADFFGVSSDTEVKLRVYVIWKFCEKPGNMA